MRLPGVVRSGMPRSAADLRSGLASHLPVLRNASSLFGVTLITAAFGAAFWAIAARIFPAAAIGLAAAAISASQLLAQASTLGLGTILIAELPRQRGSERSLILSALAINVVVGGLLAIAFGLIARVVIPQLGPLAAPKALAVFAAGVASTAAGLVLDQAFIGLLRGGLQVVRNATASGLKLAGLGVVALVATVDRGGIVLFAVWVVGGIVSIALVLRLPKPTGPARATIWRSTRGLAPLAIRHHLFNLSIYAPGLLLPLVITAVLSTEANGYFYIPYLIASFGFAVPAAMSTALYAVGVRDVAGLATRIRFAFGLCTLVAVGAAVGAFVAGPTVLSVFGPAYATRAPELLQLFALGIIPVTVNSLYVPIVRLERRFAEGTALMFLSMVIELAIVIVLARLDGLEGAAIGWLIGYSLSVLPFVPALWRVAVRGRVRPLPAPDGRSGDERASASSVQPSAVSAAPATLSIAPTATWVERPRPRFRRVVDARKEVTEAANWNIGIVGQPIDALARAGSPTEVRWLPVRRGHFAADPFGLEVDRSVHIIFEDFDHWEGRGTIGHVEIREDGSSSDPRRILDPGCHTSYPYLVQAEGATWMLPETADLGELRLYRAIDSPLDWDLEAVILPNERVSDPTVFRHEDRWWLFGTTRGRGVDQALRIWHAPALTGPWTHHALDPVKVDPRSARPAGTPYRSDGRLFRPAQDTSIRYGGRVVVNEIELLTPDRFVERPVAAIEPGVGSPYPDGLHTISAIGNATLIDGNVARFVPGAAIGAVRARLRAGRAAWD